MHLAILKGVFLVLQAENNNNKESLTNNNNSLPHSTAVSLSRIKPEPDAGERMIQLRLTRPRTRVAASG